MLPEKAPKIWWQDKIPDTEVLNRAGMQSVHTLLKLAQLRWTESLMSGYQRKYSMENFRWESAPKVQKKRCKGTLKASLKDFNIPLESWEQTAPDQTQWHCHIRKGADDYEAKRKKGQRAQSQSQGIIIRVVILRTDLLYLQQTGYGKTWPNQPSKNTPVHMNTS